MEEDARVGGEIIITSKKGDINQSGDSSGPHLHDELLQITIGFVQ